MSIGRIMYSKMPTKPKLSHFFGFGLPSNIHSFIFSQIQVVIYILFLHKKRFFDRLVRNASMNILRQFVCFKNNHIPRNVMRACHSAFNGILGEKKLMLV